MLVVNTNSPVITQSNFALSLSTGLPVLLDFDLVTDTNNTEVKFVGETVFASPAAHDFKVCLLLWF